MDADKPATTTDETLEGGLLGVIEDIPRRAHEDDSLEGGQAGIGEHCRIFSSLDCEPMPLA
jgi:hypothetical protein